MLFILVLNLYMRNVRWTFNLPNFQDRVIQGSGTRGNVGTYKSESLPNITSSANGFRIDPTAQSQYGALSLEVSSGGATAGGGVYIKAGVLSINASRSSSTYQNSAPVQQNALLIQCCIKY